jgi:hypothetical protein
MIYTITSSTGRQKQAITIEAALCHAVLMIYCSDRDRAAARENLEQGKPADIVYGFKSVTITPEEEPQP